MARTGAVPTLPQRGRCFVGCSGWDYADWRGRFYPNDLPRRQWFDHYAARFDAVEINNTFYRLPPPSTVERWAAQAPPGFTYAVKLGQFGSHRKKLRDAEQWLPNHLDRLDLLGGVAGPTLIQLPPHWHRNPARLDEFFEVAARSRRWALELRDPSWLHDDVFDVLKRHGVALCIHDLLPDHPWELTADWAYVRFHGPDAIRHPYRGRYTPLRLGPPATRLCGWLRGGIDVYAFFNNDHDACALDDASWLQDRLTRC